MISFSIYIIWSAKFSLITVLGVNVWESLDKRILLFIAQKKYFLENYS